MLKRSFVTFILTLFILSALIAGPNFSFGFGSISQLQRNFIDGTLNAAALVDVHNWATGAEARLNIFFLNLESYLLMQQGEIVEVDEHGLPIFEDNIAQRLHGMVGIGFSTKAAVATTASFTVGTLMGLNMSPGFGLEFWMGSEDNVYQPEREAVFWRDVSLAYRARIDINFFSRFSFGIHYQVPSSRFSVNNLAWEALVPDWNQGRLGASFITKVF